MAENSKRKSPLSPLILAQRLTGVTGRRAVTSRAIPPEIGRDKIFPFALTAWITVIN
jgi:hypothetical protein